MLFPSLPRTAPHPPTITHLSLDILHLVNISLIGILSYPTRDPLAVNYRPEASVWTLFYCVAVILLRGLRWGRVRGGGGGDGGDEESPCKNDVFTRLIGPPITNAFFLLFISLPNHVSLSRFLSLNLKEKILAPYCSRLRHPWSNETAGE
jgi:hypothetical protein